MLKVFPGSVLVELALARNIFPINMHNDNFLVKKAERFLVRSPVSVPTKFLPFVGHWLSVLACNWYNGILM